MSENRKQKSAKASDDAKLNKAWHTIDEIREMPEEWRQNAPRCPSCGCCTQYQGCFCYLAVSDADTDKLTGTDKPLFNWSPYGIDWGRSESFSAMTHSTAKPQTRKEMLESLEKMRELFKQNIRENYRLYPVLNPNSIIYRIYSGKLHAKRMKEQNDRRPPQEEICPDCSAWLRVQLHNPWCETVKLQNSNKFSDTDPK